MKQKSESVNWKIRMVEITSEEQNKVKRMKRTEDSLRDFWDNIKCTNIRTTGVPEEKEKKKGYEKISEEIIVENFPNIEKEIVNQLKEAQRVSYRINPRRNMPRHILIKLTRTKHTKIILKATREKQQVTQGKPYVLNSCSFSRNCRPEANGRIYLKVLKGKNLQQDYSTWQGSHSKLMEK